MKAVKKTRDSLVEIFNRYELQAHQAITDAMIELQDKTAEDTEQEDVRLIEEAEKRAERAEAALERERSELTSVCMSVSRMTARALEQELRANNLQAALERARALVASTSVPHSQWCLTKHGGPCDCYKAHLAAALGSGGAA